jgi:hypothetical protein
MPGTLVVVLCILAAIMLIAMGLKLLEVRDNRFRNRFRKAFGFHAPLRTKYDRSLREDQVAERIQAAAVELAEARANFKQSLPPLDSPEEVEHKEREYRQLRKLARRSGYSLNWLEQVHQRALDIASASLASYAA